MTDDGGAGPAGGPVLTKFLLYQTKTRAYLVGQDKTAETYHILKFSRAEASSLDVSEDPTAYTKQECSALLRQVHAGNLPHGGIQLVCQVRSPATPFGHGAIRSMSTDSR